MLKEYMGKLPQVDKEAFIAETAVLIGDVEVGAQSSVWYGAVLRGDESPIRIGRGSSVQDNVVMHCDRHSPMTIGDNVTIGHGAVVHGATVGDNVLIGMGAVVLNGAHIGKNCIVAAGAVVKERAEIPDNSMLVGVPAKIIRTLTPEQIAVRETQSYYVELAANYMSQSTGEIHNADGDAICADAAQYDTEKR